MLLAGPGGTGGGGGGAGETGGEGGGGGGRTKADCDQLSERLATHDRQCYQQHLAHAFTQFMLDAKHGTCLPSQHLIITYHGKYHHVNRDDPGGHASDTTKCNQTLCQAVVKVCGVLDSM